MLGRSLIRFLLMIVNSSPSRVLSTEKIECRISSCKTVSPETVETSAETGGAETGLYAEFEGRSQKCPELASIYVFCGNWANNPIKSIRIGANNPIKSFFSEDKFL